MTLLYKHCELGSFQINLDPVSGSEEDNRESYKILHFWQSLVCKNVSMSWVFLTLEESS